ncbi:multi-copper polyphenol oxidoreductase laccase family protein [Chlamydia ibidis]|uniref:Purine nucleoside phosphorylase n=2 Tax=Chlamydia ibidis TaxID=1405396 RepID=S7KHJ6_9CHLA|nr:peptidoglycan editing factor PgeF [Chlamydia ibidis]EPP35641.1 multi-copper polyphenol oxidoreductase laccase family protein [Chlamydia ibidis]EQM62597.1 multi-copper polyphenol oxidoreductase laccase family protein [Chlamydia ibidis 10-1398/6]
MSTTILHKLTFPELEEFPFLVHGLFPKQVDAFGVDHPPTNEQVRIAMGGKKFCDLQQVHGTSLKHISITTASGCPSDGLYTEIPDISLHIRHSDCQPAIFYDPEKHIVANVHCGWRGLVGNIYAVTVATLKKVYDSKPRDLTVVIGPSIGPDYAIYPDYQTLFPPSFFQFMPKKNHIDFRAIARKQLLDLGIQKNKLTISDRCTYTEHDIFFSSRYRNHNRDPIITGNTKKKKNNVTAVLLLPRD